MTKNITFADMSKQKKCLHHIFVNMLYHKASEANKTDLSHLIKSNGCDRSCRKNLTGWCLTGFFSNNIAHVTKATWKVNSPISVLTLKYQSWCVCRYLVKSYGQAKAGKQLNGIVSYLSEARHGRVQPQPVAARPRVVDINDLASLVEAYKLRAAK